jgi:ammonia channel protein AmtB
MALSALAITFGAVGGVMTSTGKGKIITFVAAVISGYIASVIVQTIVKSLKKIQKRSDGIDENELLLYDGKIVDTILPGLLGTVSFDTLQNIKVSYPARCIDVNAKLETGKVVKAIEFKDGIFIVESKNKYE